MRRRGWASLVMAIAIALYVADEEAHDFRSLYNPAAEAIRRALPLVPVPIFTFPVWIAGLTAGMALMLLPLLPSSKVRAGRVRCSKSCRH